MIDRLLLAKLIKSQQKIILLCLLAFASALTSFGQIRFIKPIAHPQYYNEHAYHPAELKNFYYIPVFTTNIVSEPYRFSILKLDKSGSIVNRLYFNDWENECGELYNAGEDRFWKYSIGFDSLYFANFKLFDSEFQVLKNIKVPCALRKGIPTNYALYYLKLLNGDFIFMLNIEIGISGSYTVNYIYITKEGEVKVNKVLPTIDISNHLDWLNGYNENTLWQLNDTSIVTIATERKCLTGYCLTVKKMNLNGNEFFSKNIPNISHRTFKKCGNRYYGLRERPSNGKDTLVCFDENFNIKYVKEIPDNFGVFQFWDNSDNGDFTIRGQYYDSNAYETLFDTSFTWSKANFFINNKNETLKNIKGKIRFFPTSDGGALYLCNNYKDLGSHTEVQVILVKFDTGSYCYNDNCKKMKENSIYPNPNDGDKLFFNSDRWETVSISDNLGRLILFYENESLNILNNISIESLQPGNYYLQIKFPDKTVYNKLIRF